MKQINLKIVMVISLLSLSSVAFYAHAATGVGKAIISIGKVVAISKEGKEKKLKRRSKVYEGDTIKVGGKSRLQLRFIDNHLVVLKENTIFRIDEYKFKDKNDQNKSVVLSLLKGGMRGVTGLIGKSPRDKYKVKTPVATLGVRGTHYILQLCNNDCGEGIEGLVGAVLEGEIEMTNDGGSVVFGADQFFNVSSSDVAPRLMTNPPAMLISQSEVEPGEGDLREEGEQMLVSSDSGDEPVDDTDSENPLYDGLMPNSEIIIGEQTTIETTTGTISQAVFYFGTSAPVSGGAAFSQISASFNGVGGASGAQNINATLNLETVNGVANQLVNTSISGVNGALSFQVLDGAVATEQGGDVAFGINWGRWNSADVIFTDATGTEQTLTTGLSFVYSDNLTPDLTALTSLGTQSYSFQGGPNFLDESGGVLTEDTGNPLFLNVNFTAQQVTGFGGNLIGLDGRNYLISGSGVSFSALQSGAGITLTGTCSGASICASGIPLNGIVNGAFAGSAAERFIGYIELSSTGGIVGISGSGVFAR